MPFIDLTKGLVAEVDWVDYYKALNYRWHATVCRGHAYARTTLPGGKHLFLHRLILTPDPGFVVDHIDKNGLNNKRSNLRLATHAQNQVNIKRKKPNTASRFRGVAFRSDRPKQWRAALVSKGQSQYLGCFYIEKEAAIAYAKAAMIAHGEFFNCDPELAKEIRAMKAPEKGGTR